MMLSLLYCRQTLLCSCAPLMQEITTLFFSYFPAVERFLMWQRLSVLVLALLENHTRISTSYLLYKLNSDVNYINQSSQFYNFTVFIVSQKVCLHFKKRLKTTGYVRIGKIKSMSKFTGTINFVIKTRAISCRYLRPAKGRVSDRVNTSYERH